MFQKLTLTALTLLISGVAIAGDSALYKNLDTNKDGAISQQEARALPGLNEKWVELDTNADDRLDPAEFAKMEFTDTESESESE